MSGGKTARWNDETLAATLTAKACAFIEKHSARPFFLYFATHDIHVPRVPAARFRGSSGCGIRGDVIQQFDWSVGEVVKTLDRLGLANNTLLIVTSDNGPVLMDGYEDDADQDFKGLFPAGPLRGGKYTIWEGGTRVPWIARWPGHIKADTKSAALICQVDMLASFAALTGAKVPEGAGQDSLNVLPALLGDSSRGRAHVVEHSFNITALRKEYWKYIPRLGNRQELYDLDRDIGETKSVAGQHPEVVDKSSKLLRRIREQGKEEP